MGICVAVYDLPPDAFFPTLVKNKTDEKRQLIESTFLSWTLAIWFRDSIDVL